MRALGSVVLVLLIGLALAAPVVAQEDEAPRLWLNDLTWSPDGSLLAVASNYGVIVYDLTTDVPEIRWQLATDEAVQRVRFSPNGAWLAGGLGFSGALDGWLAIWDAQTGAEIVQFKANRFVVDTIAFSPDGSQIAAGGGYGLTRMCGDYNVRVWDTATWDLITQDLPGAGSLRAIAFSPDGHLLAYSNCTTATPIVDATTYTQLAMIHEECARDILFSADSTRMTVFFNARVEYWEIRTAPEFHLVRAAKWEATCTESNWYCEPDEWIIAVHPAYFATAVDQGFIVRSTDMQQIQFQHAAADRKFGPAAFSLDGTRLAVISNVNLSTSDENYAPDFRVAIWDVAAQTVIMEYAIESP